MNKFKGLTVVVYLLVSACVFSQEQTLSDEMFVKAAELRKLAAAVQVIVRFDDASSTLSDDDVLRQATAHDPMLLSAFDNFKVRLDRRNKQAVLLICSPSGTQALLEDAACTGAFEAHHWKANPPLPCDFTVQSQSVC
jgi:hypothetical protein